MEITDCYAKYADTVYRIALMILRNTVDAEDVTQNVFIKLMKATDPFNDGEHLKAWLITVTKNICRDITKSWWRVKRGDLESVPESAYMPADTDRDIWDKVMALNEKYSLPVYLYYYEGYETEEIARILNVNHATLRTRLRAARKKLKLILEAGRAEERAARLSSRPGILEGGAK